MRRMPTLEAIRTAKAHIANGDPRRARWWLSIAGLAAVLAGCIDSNLVQCANGLACPASERCDEVHQSCVLPEQLVVCEGLSEAADCTSGAISGGCFDGVCLARGCGNRVIELGEMCDDGNQIAGDGCGGDCRSTEQCGNGFVDPGEPCDDGDLQSRDGCDSRCNVERAVWSQPLAIAPTSLDAQYAAYDAARGRLVYINQGGTWEWDHVTWTLTPLPDTTNLIFENLFYNPELERVQMIASSLSQEARVYSWINGRWERADSSTGPLLWAFPPQAITVYDTTRHRMMMIMTNTGAVWTVDSAGAWIELPSMPEVPNESVAIFDPVTSHVVLETLYSGEWVYDGVEWTSSVTSFGPRVSLAYDAPRSRVVLVNHETQTMYERIGDAWSAVDGGPAPCGSEIALSSLPMYYDSELAALSHFSSSGERCLWNGSWTMASPRLPFSPVGASHDPVSGDFVVLHNPRPSDPDSPTELWRLIEAGWQRVETPDSPYGRAGALSVYSSGRKATVLYGEKLVDPPGGPGPTLCGQPTDYDASTWSFDGADWSMLTPFRRFGMPCSSNAATYDVTHGRVVLATHQEIWMLGDLDSAWQRLATTPSSGHVFNMAWDARTGTLVAARLSENGSSPLYELRDGDWTPIEITPSGLGASSSSLVSDLRSGTVIMIDKGSGRAWERVGAQWRTLPKTLLEGLFAAWSAYDASKGRVLYIGRKDAGTFAMTMTRTSDTPLETCRAGENVDADGDGLFGCDDPDCEWDCP